VAVLSYHRVVELESDIHALCVTPRHFGEQLDVLRRYYRVLGLRRLTAALRDGRLPRRAVVLTFDDGYADNLHHAKPALERHALPATVFVTSGHVGQPREFLNDELDRLFLRPGTLPASLRLHVNGAACEWELGDWCRYDEDRYRRHRHWTSLLGEEPSPRHRLCLEVHEALRPLGHAERLRALDELAAWAGVPSEGRPTHRTLTRDELLRLAEGGLVEVGAHTVTHPQLSARPAAEQREEIRAGKADLEAVLGRPVTSFAYTYGSRADYTPETVALVREAGFDAACANFPGLVRRGADVYQLPRFAARDWDGDEFARRLQEWFRGPPSA
jgi:peptidoglycan/xylan/chitin deacetylase (PgdA/CDA1 family)